MIQFLFVNLGIIAAVLIGNVLIDFWLIRTGKGIKHGFHALIATAIVASLTHLFNDFKSLDSFISWIVFYWSTRWIVHNVALNRLRGLPDVYLGSNTLDLFLKWIDQFIHFMFFQIAVWMASFLWILGTTENQFGNGTLIGASVMVLILLLGILIRRNQAKK